MEEKRNRFRILIENGSGLKIEKTNVNPALANNIINELLEQRPSVRERETPTPQQVERDVLQTVEDFQASDEEYPEPTGRQEPVEKKWMPKERMLAKRIARGKYSDIEMVNDVIKTTKDVISNRANRGKKKMRQRSLIKLILQKYKRLPESTCYSIVTPLIKEMGYNIKKIGTQNIIYFEKMPEKRVEAYAYVTKRGGIRELLGKKLLEYQQKGRKTLKLQRLINASGYTTAGQNYIIAKKVIAKFGFKIIRTGERGSPLTIVLSKRKDYLDGRKEIIKRKLLECREGGKKTIRLKELLSSCGITRGGEIYKIATRLISKMGFEIIEKRTQEGRGKHQFIVIISGKSSPRRKVEVFEPLKRGKRKKFIAKKLLELSKEGKREIRVDKFIKLAGFNYSTGQLRETIYKEASELGFEIIRRRGSRNVLIILSKKEGKPERAWKREKREWKKQTIRDKIRDKLSELSEKGRKTIKMTDLLNSIKVNRSGTTYLLINRIISNMGFQTIRDRSKGGKRKIIILKKGFKPSPSVEKYSNRGIKIKNKLLELSKTGKKEIFGGDLIKSIGIERSGYTYRLLDDVAKDMGFEVIKTGKARSCRKKIILKKEELKGSRAYVSIYAKTLNEWEKIPTPFNLRQATFKLFGVMGGYNYNLTSMNVGQALNKLVRQGKLVRKKVLGTVQVRGKKGWGKEMWLYDLPKEGEEPQEVAPEPQEDVDLPVVSEDTLISVFNQHIEISPKTFCGFYTKTGQPITERQARFLFYWMKDNLSFVQGLTGKKITIGGFGQWQTIKIR